MIFISRITNIYTGKKYMTEVNALRHYISKGEKALKTKNYENMKKIWNNAADILDTQLCYKCSMDDFGYCGFRRDNTISEKDMFMEYCFPSLIKLWKKQLKDKIERKVIL